MKALLLILTFSATIFAQSSAYGNCLIQTSPGEFQEYFEYLEKKIAEEYGEVSSDPDQDFYEYELGENKKNENVYKSKQSKGLGLSACKNFSAQKLMVFSYQEALYEYHILNGEIIGAFKN